MLRPVPVKRLFEAAWLALLSVGCAGGFTFLIIASKLDKLEEWYDKRNAKEDGG